MMGKWRYFQTYKDLRECAIYKLSIKYYRALAGVVQLVGHRLQSKRSLV